ncbi:MAG: chemotaxis protein [Pseudomonadota bacterium]
MIESCNHTLKRISAHEYTDLLGAPHKVVRHPDMPKGAFYLVWDRLKKGKVTGAFVKNLAKDGLYYWVFALMSPLPNGYLSVCLNASSELFLQVEKIYAKLREEEQAGKLTPEASSNRFLEALQEMGYPSYNAFMAQGLRQEMDAREIALGSRVTPTGKNFDSMIETFALIRQETTLLSQTFAVVQAIPQNMRILASQLEALGGPISAISSNYGDISKKFIEWMKSFSGDTGHSFDQTRDIIDRGLFLLNASLLQDEMQTQFQQERRDLDKINGAAEIKILKELTSKFKDEAREGLRQIAQQAGQFTAAVGHMKRQVMGLSSTRMMCKIEGARLGREAEGLAEIINQLDRFQTEIEQRLSKIDGFNREVKRIADMLANGNGQTQFRSYNLLPHTAA